MDSTATATSINPAFAPRSTATPAYTGNGAYCYANSLHMSLLAAGADARTLPGPGFLECLTTVPFGRMYWRTAEGPNVFFNAPRIDPDRGLALALDALGWTCQEHYGATPEDALDRLRAAVRHGPALAGPLDMGYLSYTPGYSNAAGADHFVLVLAVEDDRVQLHDPAGFPCTMLPVAGFLAAWQAERVPYGRGPYCLRWAFQPVQPRDRPEAMTYTLPAIKANVLDDPDGAPIWGPEAPGMYGGPQALRLLAGDLRGEVPDALRGALIYFLLPLAARRNLDAAAFLSEAERPEAAALLDRQAQLFGIAQYHALHRQWEAVTALIDAAAEIEERLGAAL